jgi:long-subunit fatty acid transport protein
VKTTHLIAASVLSFVLAAPAHAGGFEIPDNGVFALGRGGAFLVRADDPTALMWNPGALVKLKGTHLLYDHALVFDHSRFTRAATDLPEGRDYGFDPLAPVENDDTLFALGGALILATDLGLADWAFAVGFYGPSAHGAKSFPTEGGQRYLLTSLEALLFYPSVSIAYGKEDSFGVGVTLQLVMAPSLEMGLVVDGSQAGGLNAYYSGNDVLATISMSDMLSFSAIFGAWWRPIPALELGVSGRVVPAFLQFDGEFTLSNVPGQTQFSEQQLSVPGSRAQMDLTIPPTAKVGARYRHLDGEREVFDVEVNLVYEAWSLVERYDVHLDGTINLFVGAEAPDTVIEKRWRDTLSVRLGGTWNVIAAESDFPSSVGDLQLSLGGFFETGAVPEGYEHLDFMSFDRFGLGFGVAGRVGPVRLKLAYAHVFQEDRVVDERFGKVYQQRPLDPCPERCDGGAGWSGVPSNAGKFESGFDVLSLGVELGL